MLATTVLGCLAAFTVYTFVTPVLATTAAVLLVWGLVTWGFNPPVQHRLSTLSSGAANLVLSLNASAIYLGVGLSGVVGGAVLRYGSPALLPEAAALLTAASLVFAVLGLRERRAARVPSAPASQSA